MPELSGIPGTLPPLLPCPMCGSDKGYNLDLGSTYRWWNVECNGCGRVLDQCRSDVGHGHERDQPVGHGGNALDAAAAQALVARLSGHG